MGIVKGESEGGGDLRTKSCNRGGATGGGGSKRGGGGGRKRGGRGGSLNLYMNLKCALEKENKA